VSIVANQSSAPQVLTVSGEGPAQMIAFGHEKTSDCLIYLQIQDGRTQRSLMNAPVHIDTIVGNMGQPFYLPEALYLDELRSVVLTFRDISGSANAVRFAAHAVRYLNAIQDADLSKIRKRMENRQYLSMPYFYTLDDGSVTVAPGVTSQFSITVGQDHHFEIMQAAAQVQDTSTLAFGTYDWDINVVETSNGESLICAPQGNDRPISGLLWFGDGHFPFRFHESRLIQVGMKLLVTLVNNHANTLRFYLTLGGRALADRMWR
jgi:hypothetical protein